jgi:transposase-like protein
MAPYTANYEPALPQAPRNASPIVWSICREDLVPRRKAFKRVSREQRAKILAAAEKQGWTAADVEKKFGISRWTFYGWRKRTGPGRGRRGAGVRGGAVVGAEALRSEIRALLPSILREEVAFALGTLLQARRGRRPRR